MGHYWVLDLPKTKGGADQYVKMPAHLVEEIEHHLSHYDISSGPVWRSVSNRNRHGRLSMESVYQIVKRTAITAGLPEIGAHTLRHTGCTLAIEAGASLQQVQTHARHKNIETTMVYIHQRDRLRDSAADFIHVKADKPSSEESE
ncbi:MAG: integrase [Bacteroidetes bacterium]|nr:MAG: integrase [Bacteroidota bacterium]